MLSAFRLRLFTDRLSPTASFAPSGRAARVLYVAGGNAAVRSVGVTASLADNCAWQGTTIPSITAGPAGATLLRFELSRSAADRISAAGVTSELTLDADPRIAPGIDYLMRCDRVDFPPGGVALTHTHRGSGIRCLQSGRIRIETEGRDFWVEPGGAWFETGADPVFAQTRNDGPSHFVRVMILPLAIRGKSSITYVKPEDKDKPKTQRYQVFVDEPIDLNDC